MSLKVIHHSGYKVFKGNLVGKYVKVPSMGGQIDGMSVMVSDGVSMPCIVFNRAILLLVSIYEQRRK